MDARKPLIRCVCITSNLCTREKNTSAKQEEQCVNELNVAEYRLTVKMCKSRCRTHEICEQELGFAQISKIREAETSRVNCHFLFRPAVGTSNSTTTRSTQFAAQKESEREGMILTENDKSFRRRTPFVCHEIFYSSPADIWTSERQAKRKEKEGKRMPAMSCESFLSFNLVTHDPDSQFLRVPPHIPHTTLFLSPPADLITQQKGK